MDPREHRIYGPQKGADADMVKILDRALQHWAEVIKRDLGMDVADIPGAGAAGDWVPACWPLPGKAAAGAGPGFGGTENGRNTGQRAGSGYYRRRFH